MLDDANQQTHLTSCIARDVHACHMQNAATVRELAAEDVTRDLKGWLRWAYAWLFRVDMFESVPASEVLMRIHSTAEKYDASAEDLLAPFQAKMFASHLS